MNVHKHARLTVHGRQLLVGRVLDEGWQVKTAAQAAGVSERTGYKWLGRFRAGGAAALSDRKATPGRCPHRLAAERVAAPGFRAARHRVDVAREDQRAPAAGAGALVVLESTTYPGTTRDVLLPRLEARGLASTAAKRLYTCYDQ